MDDIIAVLVAFLPSWLRGSDWGTTAAWAALAGGTLLAAHALTLVLQSWRADRIRTKCAALEEEAGAWKPAERIPVTIVTGFLGAGKTTLLNALLRTEGKRICVIENEVGSVSLDHDLLRSATAGFAKDVFVLANGCVCCSADGGGMGGELERVLDLVLELVRASRASGEASVDHVVIETSGLADPAPLVELFFAEGSAGRAAPSSAFELRGVVAVVDAKHGLWHLRTAPSTGWLGAAPSAVEATRQVAFADRVLLNKVDLLPGEGALEAVEAAVRAVNPSCGVVRAVRGVPLGEERGQGDPPTAGQTALLGRSESPGGPGMAEGLGGGAGARSAGHVHGSASSVTLRPPRAVRRAALEVWLGDLVTVDDRWRRLYRLKGPVLTSEGGWVLVQGVHAEVHVSDWEGAAPEGPGAGFLVAIGPGVSDEGEALQASLDAACVGGE